MSAPIMSRFDLFFVVLDECKPDIDKMIANYIVGTHRHGDDNINPYFDTAKLQRYIRYARTFKPKVREVLFTTNSIILINYNNYQMLLKDYFSSFEIICREI